MKLRVKLALWATVMVLFVSSGISVFLFLSGQQMIKNLVQEGEENKIGLVKNLSHVCRDALIIQDHLAIINYVGSLKNNNKEVVNAAYVNNEGKVVAHTDPEQLGTSMDYAAGIGFADSQYVKMEYARDIFDYFSPVMVGDERKGTACIRFSQEEMDKTIKENRKDTWGRIFIISVLSVLLGLLGAAVLAGAMSRPINRLARGAIAIGEGNLDTVINVRSKDELGALAKEFNRMARRLKELDDLKDAFISNITHDLKSPLGAMKGYVDFILKGKMGPVTEKQIEALNIVKNNSVRLGNFIEDILDYARIKSGKIELLKEPVDIGELVKREILAIKPVTEKKNITLMEQIPDKIERINVDSNSMGRVISNLFTNACKFTPEGGSITITVEDKDREQVVSVSDTGIGIPEDDVDMIFERFHQVRDHIKKVRTRGTGLGLAIVRGVVEAHGGKVSVQSKEGKGSTFRFTIPKG